MCFLFGIRRPFRGPDYHSRWTTQTGAAHYRVVITGGSKGIGRGIALAFGRAGAAVSICARGTAALEETYCELAQGGKAHRRICDLSDSDSVTSYIESAAAALGGIDVLINNASGFGWSDDEAGWAAAVNVDLMATVRASHAALPWMEQNGHANFVHITSSAAFKPSVHGPAYSAIKAALVHYTRSHAKALAPKGIRVNSVAPGTTEAPGNPLDKLRLAGDPIYEKLRAGTAAGRLGSPDEIADVVLFLSSPAARWINGQTILADGGQHLFGEAGGARHVEVQEDEIQISFTLKNS